MMLKNRYNVALNISKIKPFEIFCKVVLASHNNGILQLEVLLNQICNRRILSIYITALCPVDSPYSSSRETFKINVNNYETLPVLLPIINPCKFSFASVFNYDDRGI